MSDLAWLFVAFAAVWVALGAYLLSIAVRQRRLERRLDDLRPPGTSETA
jgi:CcmD family protein